MKMEKKLFDTELEFKEDADQTGSFKAVFSWFNVIDKQGDITVPGAFEEGAPIKIAYWGHRWENLPVGRGEIHQDDEKAWVEGRFFLDTEAGLETYKTVKNLGDLQEWSYGFEALDSAEDKIDGKKVRVLKKLKTFEVSPVFIGVGNNTQTLAIKGEDDFSKGEDDSSLDMEPEIEVESEADNVGNESDVDSADIKLLIEILALEGKD
jgi:HK97 family phage prohead protease